MCHKFEYIQSFKTTFQQSVHAANMIVKMSTYTQYKPFECCFSQIETIVNLYIMHSIQRIQQVVMVGAVNITHMYH